MMLQPEDARKVAFKLAHFDPTTADDCGNQMLDYLVLDALATTGPLLTSQVRDVISHIDTVFHLQFEAAEVGRSCARLASNDMVELQYGQRNSISGIQIEPQVAAQITGNVREIEALEDRVLAEWGEQLTARYSDYPILLTRLDQCIENLKSFAARMFIKHGAESVALIYPERSKTREWLMDVERGLLDGLPEIHADVDAILSVEIPRFFKRASIERRAYIANLFNASFFWHLIQVDEECSQLLSTVTAGQSLYLDNNVLYGLVGINGPDLMAATSGMLTLARRLGYDLRVTTKTVEEYHKSLEWQLSEYRERLPIPSELARVAAEQLDEEDFLTSYWRALGQSRTTIEEFVAEKRHIDVILDGLEIAQTDILRGDIERSSQLQDEISLLDSITGGGLNGNVIEHDAFHRVLLLRLRGRPRYHIADSEAWFLTQDTKLPHYDRVARKGSNELPFCVTSEQWVQINRPLLPRTEDFERSFHVLVTQPFIRNLVTTASLESAYEKVLGRLARYKNMSPQLALGVTMDTHFMLTVTEDPGETAVEEKIRAKVVNIAEQLRQQKERLESESEAHKRGKARLEDRLAALEKERREDDEKWLQRHHRELRTQEGELSQRITALEDVVAEKEAARNGLERRLGRYRTIAAWSGFIIILTAMSVYLWGVDVFLGSPWRTFFTKLAVQLALAFLLLIVPIRKHWIAWLTLCAAFATTAIALAATR